MSTSSAVGLRPLGGPLSWWLSWSRLKLSSESAMKMVGDGLVSKAGTGLDCAVPVAALDAVARIVDANELVNPES